MNILINEEEAPVTSYKPWKLGELLIRQNDGSVKLWRQHEPWLIFGVCIECGAPAGTEDNYACDRHADHNGGDNDPDE